MALQLNSWSWISSGASAPAPATFQEQTVNIARADYSDEEASLSAKHRAAQASQIDTEAETSAGNTGSTPPGSTVVRFMPMGLALMWAIMVIVGLVRLGRTYRRIVGIKARSYPLNLDRYPSIRRRLTAPHTRAVTVRLSSDISTPMAAGLGSPTVLIPDAVAENLDGDDLEAIVLHEIAHLERWDDWTKLAQKIIEALFIFHPAVHFIGRQLELERELACDEWAVAQSGQVERYARSLTRLVQLTNGGITTLIPGALTSRKQIFRRFERLLLYLPTDSLRRARINTAGLMIGILAAALLLAGIAPAVTLPFRPMTLAELGAAPTEPPQPDRDHESGTARRAARVIGTGRVADDGTVYGATISTNGEAITTTYIDDTVTISAEQEGDLELSPDGRQLINLSQDTRFKFKVELRKDRYTLIVEPGESGRPEYTFYRNDRLQVYDKDAQRWFGDMLEFFAAETGFAARGRLRKLMQEGGLDAALTFIADHLSPHARRYYYEQLLEIEEFSETELRRIGDHADDVLTDDYDRDYIRERIDDLTGEGDNGNGYSSSWSINWSDDAQSRSLASSRSSQSSSTAVFATSTDSVRDLDSILAALNLSRKIIFDADWEAEFKRGRPWLNVTFYYDRNSRSSFSLALDTFTGIDESWRTERADDVRFLLMRGAGVFDFRGGFNRGFGDGEFVFRVNEDYLRELDEMGYRVSRLDDFELFKLALFDVSGTFIKEMEELGYEGLSLDRLIQMRIHGVKPEAVRELRDLGYRVSADRLIEFQIHGVAPWFIEELADAGLKNLSAEQLVEFRIHGVEADQVAEFRDLGLGRLSADDLVKFRIHRVTPDFVRDLQKQGYRDLSPDRLVEFRIHSVSPSMIDELSELGYNNLTAEELKNFSIHGVTPDFIRDLRDLGYDRIFPEDLISMRIHGVTPSYIKRMAKRGYDNLSVEDLIDFRIHGID